MQPVEVIDSHTEGEPTRVVIAGWPLPEGDTVAQRRDFLQHSQNHLRRATVLEPRGHDAIVGALLVPADRPEAETGVIFFNDVACLGMCGHGTIGVVRTLAWLGRIGPGRVELDTPVGPVSAWLDPDGRITIRNVPARYDRQCTVEVPGLGEVVGDIAWGGNWFFLTHLPGLPLRYDHRMQLTEVTTRIRSALQQAGIRSSTGESIDHVELFAAPEDPANDARNFVLCPGAAYDRSPCGTGTSAKMAALHARGELQAGQHWQQESIIGSRFTGWLEQEGDQLIPLIQGRAFITGRNTLLYEPDDPFVNGIG